MSTREWVILVIDGMAFLACVAIFLWCIVSVYSSLKNGYLFYRGQRASKDREPAVFWYLIVCWLLVAGLFGVIAVRKVLALS